MVSKRPRDLLTVGMILLLAITAFGSGYLFRDLGIARSDGFSFSDNEGSFGLFWEAWEKIEQNFLGDIPGEKTITYAALRGSLSALEDPYTFFVEPEAHAVEEEELRGNFGGVGAFVSKAENGDVILSPMPDNPAEDAGIQDGDILVAVDGWPLASETPLDEVIERVRGEIGTEVILTVIHPGESEAIDISVTRQPIVQPSVDYRLVEADPSIGYIRLFKFSGESGGEVAAALEDLISLGVEGIILDVRQNPGGLLTAAVEVSDHFLDEGPILYQISKSDDEKVFTASDETIAPRIPLVILVDGSSASASEIVAGALQDRERAILVGSTTFGKGSVQLVHELSDGSAVHVTIARWYTPDRHQIDKFGLQPDIEVEQSHESAGTDDDLALQAAIEYLQ